MITDTSIYAYSFNGYVYGDNVAELREEPASKLAVTKAAGMNGGRIGASFEDLKRVILSGELTEDCDDSPTTPVLRQLIQRFRYAHRAEAGKQKLYLNSAADGRPAEFVWAAREAISGLRLEQPINRTDFEVSFIAEPEIWYDAQLTASLRQNQSVVGVETSYAASVTYNGPAAGFYADAEALPLIVLTVASLNAAQLGTADPPFITIGINQDLQSFKLFPDANGTFHIDSYEEGIRKGASWAAGAIYERADYEQFLYLKGAHDDAGLINAVTLLCRHCDVSAAPIYWYARHW